MNCPEWAVFCAMEKITFWDIVIFKLVRLYGTILFGFACYLIYLFFSAGHKWGWLLGGLVLCFGFSGFATYIKSEEIEHPYAWKILFATYVGILLAFPFAIKLMLMVVFSPVIYSIFRRGFTVNWNGWQKIVVKVPNRYVRKITHWRKKLKKGYLHALAVWQSKIKREHPIHWLVEGMTTERLLRVYAPGVPPFNRKRSHNPMAYHRYYVPGTPYVFYIMEYINLDKGDNDPYLRFWGYEIDTAAAEDPGITLCSWYRSIGMMQLVEWGLVRDPN